MPRANQLGFFKLNVGPTTLPLKQPCYETQKSKRAFEKTDDDYMINRVLQRRLGSLRAVAQSDSSTNT
ncbi:hypothetical protein CWI38_0298p0020 [Hamiltosporidium tvaerminnensis]|uniref:Uncharacterized protein n=1 Tax=Hamiltosporidium tvaerminnensis TaxID=1176355 RepID=A0A4Q9LYI6_9MICR|nr:hypothetical protein CWI38_0298p0020 [Hamiltosporidium tvaerminnensis]